MAVFIGNARTLYGEKVQKGWTHYKVLETEKREKVYYPPKDGSNKR